MNKKTLVTAVALGAALVYAVRRLKSRVSSRQQQSMPGAGMYGNSRHHLTDVFSRAKPQPMEQL